MPPKLTIGKGERPDKYSRQLGGKVRGSPIDPSMGNDTRLIGTVVLSKRQTGQTGQVADKPSPTVKGQSGKKY